MTSAVDLPFIVKICGITNEEDAQAAVEAGANALGFNFYKRSPRYVTPTRARRIAEAVAGSFLRVGVFVNPTKDELAAATGEAQLDVVQLHGDECPRLSSLPYRIWRAMDPTTRPPANDPIVEAHLLDTPSLVFGGSGITFTWTLAAKFPYRAIIAGGLDAANVAEAIGITTPWGVDACSRLESAPGKKDLQKVRDFVRAAWAGGRSIPQESTL